MVRVGGGWDTLAHYLDKHDPCRCRAQHRTSLSARLARPRADLAGATVTYERPSDSPARQDNHSRHDTPVRHDMARHYDRHSHDAGPTSLPYIKTEKTPEPSRDRYESLPYNDMKHYHSNNRLDAPTSLPYLGDVDRAPSPNRRIRNHSPARKSSSPDRRTRVVVSNHLVPTPHGVRNRSPRPASPAPQAESASDNGSEVSDEGYRSLGVVAASAQGSPSMKTTNRYSLHSQNSIEDAEFNGKFNFIVKT